ncbi:MAG: DUF2231 domain-containing protein [Gammaproteobacteria bacterium]
MIEIEIIPNWHPIFVHFAIGLLGTSAVLFLLARFIGQKSTGGVLVSAAHVNLGFGTVLALLAIVSGLYAFNTVNHDDLGHQAMKIHRWWAFHATALFVIACAWLAVGRRRGVERSALFLIWILTALVALATTGYLGAENVYRHGLGVRRIPATTDNSGGHAHSAMTAPVTGDVQSRNDGHHHGPKTSTDHAHAR